MGFLYDFLPDSVQSFRADYSGNNPVNRIDPLGDQETQAQFVKRWRKAMRLSGIPKLKLVKDMCNQRKLMNKIDWDKVQDWFDVGFRRLEDFVNNKPGRGYPFLEFGTKAEGAQNTMSRKQMLDYAKEALKNMKALKAQGKHFEYNVYAKPGAPEDGHTKVPEVDGKKIGRTRRATHKGSLSLTSPTSSSLPRTSNSR